MRLKPFFWAVAVLVGATGIGLAAWLGSEVTALRQRDRELQADLNRLTANFESARAEDRRAWEAANSAQRAGPGSAGPAARSAATNAVAVPPGRPQPAPLGVPEVQAGREEEEVVGQPAVQRVHGAARYARARQRDSERFPAAILQEIDRLFEDGQLAIRTEEGKAKLRELVDRYPASNRGGCAAMNLGSEYLEEGRLDEARRYLEPLVQGNSESVYSGGERVLVKALYDYGILMERMGQPALAQESWQRILVEFPSERDVHGASYASLARDRLR